MAETVWPGEVNVLPLQNMAPHRKGLWTPGRCASGGAQAKTPVLARTGEGSRVVTETWKEAAVTRGDCPERSRALWWRALSSLFEDTPGHIRQLHLSHLSGAIMIILRALLQCHLGLAVSLLRCSLPSFVVVAPDSPFILALVEMASLPLRVSRQTVLLEVGVTPVNFANFI